MALHKTVFSLPKPRLYPQSAMINLNDCLQTCPEQMSDSRTYTHNMHFDYGKITGSPKKISQKMEVAGMETKRIYREGIPANQTLQNRSTAKKKPIDLVGRSVPTEKSENGRRVAAKLTHVSSFQKRENGGRPSVQNSVDCGRRKVHSRILKTMVGGGKTLTKIISYPDNRAYLRLCGLRD